jgi:predicted dehydrogenase
VTLRLGFIGAGYIARIHAAAALTLGATLAAVANHRDDSRARFAAQFGVEREYSQVEDLVAADVVDALVICTPNALHATQAILALESGIPVLVEKPMAINAPEAERMVAAAEQAGVPLMVAHCWRFDAEARWLRARIQEGGVGEPVRTSGYGIHVNWGPKGWFTEAALAGGGASLDMGIHAVDTARFLLGDPTPTDVYAKISSRYGATEVDDTGQLLVTWDSGQTSYIEFGWQQPHADGPEAATQVYGTEGYGRLYPTRLERPHAEPEDPGFVFPRVPHCLPSMYEAQLSAFITAVRTGRVEEAGPRVGLDNMRILDAAVASARTGEAVHL